MTDDELHALYARARAEEAPSLEDRRVVKRAVLRAAVMAGAAATATTTTAAAAPLASALTLGKVVSAIGLGFTIGAATFSGALAVSSALAPKAASGVSSAPPAPRPVNGASPQPEPPSAALAAEEPIRPSSPAARSDRARDTVRGPSARPAEPVNNSLAEETRALTEVQRELASGNARRALALLTEQDRRFAGGALGEERAAARVIVLCAGGHVEQARAARARFMDDYPRSPLVKRVLAACGIDRSERFTDLPGAATNSDGTSDTTRTGVRDE